MMGFIVEFLKRTMETFLELYGRDVVNDHILVLGWTDKTLFLLRQLIILLDDEARHRAAARDSLLSKLAFYIFDRRPTIVILGHTKRLDMMGEARLTLPRGSSRVARIIFRQGLLHEIETLNKVSVHMEIIATYLVRLIFSSVSSMAGVCTLGEGCYRSWFFTDSKRFGFHDHFVCPRCPSSRRDR